MTPVPTKPTAHWWLKDAICGHEQSPGSKEWQSGVWLEEVLACGTTPALLPPRGAVPTQVGPQAGSLGFWASAGSTAGGLGGRREGGEGRRPMCFPVPCLSRWPIGPCPRPDPCPPPCSLPWTLGGSGRVCWARCRAAPEISPPRQALQGGCPSIPLTSPVPGALSLSGPVTGRCGNARCLSVTVYPRASHNGPGSSHCPRSLCVCVGGGRICTIQGLTESVPREVSTPMLWPVFLHTVGASHDLDWIRAPGRYESRGAMRERPRPWLCRCVWPSSRVRPWRAVPGEEGPGRAAVAQRVGGLVVPPPPASLEHVAETQTLGLPCICSEDKGPRCSGAGRSLGPSHGVCREPQ